MTQESPNNRKPIGVVLAVAAILAIGGIAYAVNSARAADGPNAPAAVSPVADRTLVVGGDGTGLRSLNVSGASATSLDGVDFNVLTTSAADCDPTDFCDFCFGLCTDFCSGCVAKGCYCSVEKGLINCDEWTCAAACYGCTSDATKFAQIVTATSNANVR